MTTMTTLPPAPGAAPSGLFAHFADLPDPRKRPHECDDLLLDIISIAILAVICGADEVTALETFGHARQETTRHSLARYVWAGAGALVAARLRALFSPLGDEYRAVDGGRGGGD
jgi:DDE_Tnp_1-associated